MSYTIWILGLIGLCLGSFINALVWRLHESSKIQEKSDTKLTKTQRSRLKQLSITKGRSICPHCEHQLAWYDLIPVISWLYLRGKCRYCQVTIAIQYPLVEITTALVFVLSYLWWPYDITSLLGVVLLAIWLIMTVILVALVVYDARWYILPNKLTYPLIGLALIYGLVRTLGIDGLSIAAAIWQLLLGAMSVGGLYWVLYRLSDGRWVGGGDGKLGTAMGMILGWQTGLLSVFLANILALVAVTPGLISKKLSAKSHVPFGPFLIASLFISVLFGQFIVEWYLQSFVVI